MIPPDVSVALNDLGRSVPDTDWWIDDLYAGIAERFGATVVRQEISRYVIDVNRDPSGVSLYPGQNTTTLCPTITFDGEPIYMSGRQPGSDEIMRRRATWFEPFHAALAGAIQRALIRHGWCMLYDCHSIRSVIPNLFEGTLPDFSIGTNEGRACAAPVKAAAVAVAGLSGRSFVADGRFKGGWITRHYGRPEAGIHAVQMELAQAAYMDESPPWSFRPDRAGPTAKILADIVAALLEAAEQHERPRR
jgi:formiminoglutamase